MLDPNEIGKSLARLLEERNISQRSFAKMVDATPSHINKIIKGKGGRLSLELAAKFAKVLNVPVGTFAGEGPLVPELAHDVLAIPRYTENEFRPHAGESTEPIDYIYRRKVGAARQSLEAYVISGTCLMPRVPDGATIIVDREANIDYGNIVACRIDEQFHLGYLRKIGDETFLENNHGRYKATDCHPIARVVQIATDV